MSIGNVGDDGRIAALAEFGSLGSPSLTVGGSVKRLFDLVFAVAAIAVFGTLMLGICVVLKLNSGGPILFVQPRVGKEGKRFPCLKFRTMAVDAEDRLRELLATDPDAAAEFAAIHKLKNDPRIIPRIGTFLRKTSLDELPQFFNVLAGHMSIVGPRPVTGEEWSQHYGAQHPYILARPGITGLWQISGRNEVSYPERCQMDAAYIRNWSFGRDMTIILRTVGAVCVDRSGY
jgi:lipopolysaccharide/colanic/teichoic acid biosynthesis glycosyltransferase